MDFFQSQVYLRQQLATIYDSREASTISDWVLEKLTGLNKLDRLMYKEQELTSPQRQLFDSYLADLLSGKPVQYVFGEADFFGLKFYVDENVLIPRPETEELVQWVIDENSAGPLSVLDIGTGSGCIAISLKYKKPQFNVSGCDISSGALEVARQNAANNKVTVNFFSRDILDTTRPSSTEIYDIIVSNPPYIPPVAKGNMNGNVLDYEPHLALFTPADDPFLFYRAIGQFGQSQLIKGGRLYFEIHEDGADGVISLLNQQGYSNTRLRNDLYGKPRMIAATR